MQCGLMLPSRCLVVSKHACKPCIYTQRQVVRPAHLGCSADPGACTAPVRRERLARVEATAGGAAVPGPNDAGSGPSSSGSSTTSNWLAAAGGAIAIVAAGAYAVTTGQWDIIKDQLINGPLGKSGFAAAFSLIFLSEIGDKTFFIAALLAMRLGRWLVFAGSLGALAVMTVISVGIGAVFSRVPDALKSSLPVGEIAGVLLLVYFGMRALREATKTEPSTGSEDELADAKSTVQEAESSGKVGASSTLASLFEVASLIFLAEWGDRSMLATIALGAAQNPVGVAVGATAGHAIATAIAVVGGALVSKHVSEKMVNFTSGILFLLFAAATTYTLIA